MSETKYIYISYAEADKESAASLRDVLEVWFDDRIWMRDFDLNGGDLVLNVLDGAIAEASWLVVLLTKSAIASKWIEHDATLGTIRALESEDIRILVVRLEQCEYPDHLQLALKTQPTIDLSGQIDKAAGFMQVADYIESAEPSKKEHIVYEGRGSDTDRFSLTARRNKVVFVIGWRGIGKTAFVEQSIGPLLRKRARTVRLSHGFSHDLLARQVIYQMRTLQPSADPSISDHALMAAALDALRQRSDHFFLFLDNVQYALDGSNRLLPYLSDFLLGFQSAEIDTHVVLATTRNPDFPEELVSVADVFRLGTLEDEYIREAMIQWLDGCDQQALFSTWTERTRDLVGVIGGHPVAAKRMASYLKLKSADQLLTVARREDFTLRFADYILRATQSALGDIHRLILGTLATIREPVSLSDILQVTELVERYSLEQVHQAMWELTNWFLLEQTGELIYLHSFLIAHFSRQLRSDEDLRRRIAEDFGSYACNRAHSLNARLEKLQQSPDSEQMVRLSSDVFRFSLIADALLRSVGQDTIAEDLPIRTKGVLRGLVYYFYQDVKDYPRALEYANKWLEFNPRDSDIQMYQIRCHRRLGHKKNMKAARTLISQIDPEEHSLFVKIRLVREKALMALQEGDVELAKTLFRQAIRLDRESWQPYSEIYAGLARILIQEADDLHEWDPTRLKIAREAIELLDVARKEPENFYRFHLDAYVEALILAGREHDARPLLEETLEYRSSDGKLNFKMAEILRREKDYEAAKDYAQKAIDSGYAASLLTYANILYDQALQLRDYGNPQGANELFAQALNKVRVYQEQYGVSRSAYNIEVADAIRSKIHRAQGEIDQAQSVMQPYHDSNDPYTVYEQAILCKIKSEKAMAESRDADALANIQRASEIIRRYRYTLSSQLETLRDEVLEQETQIRERLGL